MKPYLKICIILFITLAHLCAPAQTGKGNLAQKKGSGKKPAAKAAKAAVANKPDSIPQPVVLTGAEAILTTHQWTLVEMINISGDTVLNMTMALTGCEKDNYLQYASSGKYEIKEGASKCDAADKDIKGEGEWYYSAADSTLAERYESGKEIPKTVLLLNDEIMKIKYVGEGRKTIILTYFSEIGLLDETNADMAVDNSKSAQNIQQIIRNYIISGQQHILIGNKQFANGIRSSENNKNGTLQTVALLPFAENADAPVTNDVKTHTVALQEKAKKAETNLIISGKVKKERSEIDKKGKFTGYVEYEVNILDAASGEITTKTFAFNSGEYKEKGKFWKKVGKIAQAAPIIVIGGAMATISTINDPYRAKRHFEELVVNPVHKINKGTDPLLSSSVKDSVRSRYFDSTTALLTAITASTDELEDFVGDHIAHKIKIVKLDGDDKKAPVIIAAGSNLGLSPNDELIVFDEPSKEAGATNFLRAELGTIKVEKVLSDTESICSFDSKEKSIVKAFGTGNSGIVAIVRSKRNTETKK